MVHVTIEDQHLVHATGFEQVMTDNRQVVENAKAGRVVVMSMMSAPGQMTGDAMLQRLLGGQQRTTDCPYGTLRQGFAPGQAEAALVLAG
ncbi:hypothetical protein D3C77_558500 [compost metagenome]